MSLITRCPACGTMFKVVPDQLRISEGWVRCGHCSEVFDASANLQDEEAGVAAPGTMGPAGEARVESPPHGPAPVSEPEPEEFGSSLTTEVGDGPFSEVPDSALLEEQAQVLTEDPRDQPFVLRPRDEALAPLDRPQLARPAPVSEPEPDVHELSFVRQARRKEFWGRPVVRFFLVIALAGLGVALALQVALHDRDRLAATEPQLRPVLVRLCEQLQCSIGPPRQIDAIAIDGSSFNKLRSDTFRLNVTLKNQGGVVVAMPALELTLTDSQEQALVRRVLMPSELQPNPGVIASGSEWSGSVALAVAANSAGTRIAGYRLLAFYP